MQPHADDLSSKG